MVDWYYIYSILPLGVYSSPQSIYNVRAGRAQPIQYVDLTYSDTHLSLPILVPGELGTQGSFKARSA
jgi:hypothetical protein